MKKAMILALATSLIPTVSMASPLAKAEKESKSFLSAVEKRAEKLADAAHKAGEKAVKSAARGLKESAHQANDAAHSALKAVR
jgi:hypothetical protein